MKETFKEVLRNGWGEGKHLVLECVLAVGMKPVLSVIKTPLLS
jgi:hypothetical protein